MMDALPIVEGKITRYLQIYLGYNGPVGERFCRDEDVAALEAKHAALLEVAGKMADKLESLCTDWGCCPMCGKEQNPEGHDTGCAIAAYREVVKCPA